VSQEEVFQVACDNLDPARRAEGVVRGTGITSRAAG
jgi:hypothetical protein